MIGEHELTDLPIVIQASSRSWSGGRDICLNEVAGKAAIVHLIEKIVADFPTARFVIAAPEFDGNGDLPQLLAPVGATLKFVFAHDASPLKRMIAAAEALESRDFLRINGLNMWVQTADLAKMWRLAKAEPCACIKFPDAYPAQLTFDYYRCDALEALARRLDDKDPAQVHPKYALFAHDPGDCRTFEPQPPNDETLLRFRSEAILIYKEARDAMTATAIAVGDTLGFHYELALPWLEPSDQVLDIACGGYRGPQRLRGRVASVIAADIDAAVIAECSRHHRQDGLTFEVADATQLPYETGQFDAVTSFETIEHVDAQAYFKEIARVLKPGGVLILSTPQNSLGHVPINPQHHIEYSLDALKAMIAASPFEIVKLQGIKQGRVMIEGDETGNNSFVVLRRG